MFSQISVFSENTEYAMPAERGFIVAAGHRRSNARGPTPPASSSAAYRFPALDFPLRAGEVPIRLRRQGAIACGFRGNADTDSGPLWTSFHDCGQLMMTAQARPVVRNPWNFDQRLGAASRHGIQPIWADVRLNRLKPWNRTPDHRLQEFNRQLALAVASPAAKAHAPPRSRLADVAARPASRMIPTVPEPGRSPEDPAGASSARPLPVLASRPIDHDQNATAATMQMAEKKPCAHCPRHQP